MSRRVGGAPEPRRSREQTRASAPSPGFTAPAGLDGGLLHVGSLPLLVLSYTLTETDALAKLSPAEREVATFVARGDTNAEIARRRRVSVNTVAKQVAAILRKTKAHSRFELIACLSGCGGRANPL